MRSLLGAFCLGISLWGAMGCGGTMMHRPPTLQVDMSGGEEINDEDVRKAFEARPQMKESIQVAYFALDEARASSIEGMLGSIPEVRGVYRIPSLVVGGERRWAERSPWAEPKALSIKKLRLLAARSHADVLIVADSGGRAMRDANGLVAFGVALVPLLFLPWLNSEVESYLDLYVIDVRNGYLYGHLSSNEKGEVKSMVLWSKEEGEMMEGQWGALLKRSQEHLVKLLAEEKKQGGARGEGAALLEGDRRGGSAGAEGGAEQVGPGCGPVLSQAASPR